MRKIVRGKTKIWELSPLPAVSNQGFRGNDGWICLSGGNREEKEVKH